VTLTDSGISYTISESAKHAGQTCKFEWGNQCVLHYILTAHYIVLLQYRDTSHCPGNRWSLPWQQRLCCQLC